MKVAVLSSLYGTDDEIHEPVWQSMDAEWIFITDRPRESTTWKVVVEPREGVDDRLASRRAKCRPDLYTEADVVIWLDARFEVDGNEYVSWMTGILDAYQADIAMYRHPFFEWRDEAEGSLRSPKYQGQPLVEQAATFTDPGAHWAAGVSVRRMTPAVRAFGAEWLETLGHWGSGKDQVAMAPLIRAHDLRVHTLHGCYWQQAGLVLHGRADERPSRRARWKAKAKARWGWRCPFCGARRWSWEPYCANSWVTDGERRGCRGTNPDPLG